MGRKFTSNRIGMNLTMMCDFTNDGTTFEAWVMMQQHLKIGIIYAWINFYNVMIMVEM
jgi:hypothetical protein